MNTIRLLAYLGCAALSAPLGAAGLGFDWGQQWRAQGLLEPSLGNLRLMSSTHEHLAQPLHIEPGGFDSWRLTVRYTLVDADQGNFGFGLTTRQPEPVSASTLRLPDSPLLHAFGEYRFFTHWRLAGSLDAGGLRPGRDLGLGLQLSYELSRAWSVSAGYRLQDQRPLDESNPALRSNWFSLGTRLAF